ncbi:hypothetical protein CMUS01_02739 [Colletotrichum musicola]|uniref:Uncharacterized protein n=1 Tax=Colletotrichum musicola TaxID=2175873 RepID=A0A8H6NUI2_9PEZI|nr:hypothetical protein CMUS01_02739 [Colletotrichum musicola]
MEPPIRTQSPTPSIELEDFGVYWAQLYSSEDVTELRLRSENPSSPATPQTVDIEANELAGQFEDESQHHTPERQTAADRVQGGAGRRKTGVARRADDTLSEGKLVPLVAPVRCFGHLHRNIFMLRHTVDYELDYMSMMLPTVLVKSFRQKHYLVFLVTATSLLLKAQIVLAPGLFLVTRVQFPQSIDVKVIDIFNTEPGTILVDDSRAYYTAQSIQRFKASFPFGSAKGVTYQRFSPRGELNAPISVTVDGFFVYMSCLKLSTYNVTMRERGGYFPPEYHFNFGFERCGDVAFQVRGNQFVYLALDGDDQTTETKSSDFAAVICSPNIWASKVEVIDDGISSVLGKVAHQAQSAIELDLWPLIMNSTPNAALPKGNKWPGEQLRMQASKGQHLKSAEVSPGREFDMKLGTNLASSNSTEVLFDYLVQLAEYSGPLAIHYGLRRANEANIVGQKRRANRVRTVFVVVVVGLMATLNLTLLRSQQLKGISTSNEYWHWTVSSFATLVALAVTLYATSYDTALRSLSVLGILTRREAANFNRLDLSMLDAMGPHALLMSFRLRIWALSASQAVAFFCAFLTTASSTLFTLEYVPKSLDLQLQQKSWFGDRPLGDSLGEYRDNRQALSSMLLHTTRGNITYPKNTFEDLVFPILNTSAVEIDIATKIGAQIKMPSARPASNCTKMDADVFNIHTTMLNLSERTYINAEVTIPSVCPDGKHFNISTNFWIEYTSEGSTTRLPFAKVLDSEENMFDVESYISCVNETLVESEELEPVYVVDNHLRPKFPMGCPFPVVKEQNVNDTAMDVTFGFLIEPHGPIPAEAFGDPGLEQTILNELNHNRALISAQLLNLESRFDIDEGSNSTAFPPERLDTVDGVLIDYDNRRIVQNTVETYILTAILGVVAAANILALLSSLLRRWRPLTRGGIFDMNVKGLAPKDFQSILMTASLLESSNATEHIPIETQSLSRDECNGILTSLRFRLGWFRRESDQTRHFTIGVMGDDNFTFLSNEEIAVDKEHDETESLR